MRSNKAFFPNEALQLAQKLEIHHTPKHGSWLDKTEIEIDVMSRQCLKGYLSAIDAVTSQVNDCALAVMLAPFL